MNQIIFKIYLNTLSVLPIAQFVRISTIQLANFYVLNVHRQDFLMFQHFTDFINLLIIIWHILYLIELGDLWMRSKKLQLVQQLVLLYYLQSLQKMKMQLNLSSLLNYFQIIFKLFTHNLKSAKVIKIINQYI